MIIKDNKIKNIAPNNICKFKNAFDEKLFLSSLSVDLFKFQNELPLVFVVPEDWLAVSSMILFIFCSLSLLLSSK